jgi:hypothetical protein
MGGWAAELTTGQKATQTAVMDGISVVYSTSPGAGSLEVRDGVGGTLLTTINTNSAAKSSNIWTSGSLTLASHTIEIRSVGTTILEGVYVHNGTRNKGIRVWSASHSGYTSQQMYSNPSFALDLIDNVNPDLVVIATGTNDGAANYATYMAGMISAVQLHTSADIAIWLPYTSPSGFPSTEDTAARAFLSTVGLPIIDAGYGVPNLAARFSPDNVHPNDNGHILLANHVFASIGGDPLGQFANQIGQNEITLATKAPIANPVFTGTITGSLEGSVTLNDIYGSASIGSIFGSPVIGLSNAIGDANPAIAFFPSTLAGMLGYPSATIIFGPGGVTSYDVGLTRTGSGEMTFFGSNSSTKSQLVVADPTTPGHATTKSYVDSRNHQLIAKESGQYYSMTGLTTASTSLTMTASGVLTSHPAFLQAGTYDRISVITTVAAVSTWRFGVYPSSPSTGLPDGEALILDCGTINMNSTPNLLTATISLTIPTTGVYWLGCLVDAYTATPTVHGWTTVSGTAQTPLLGAPVNNSGATAGRHAIGRTLTGVGTGSMPATYPASSWSQASPRISLRAS